MDIILIDKINNIENTQIKTPPPQKNPTKTQETRQNTLYLIRMNPFISNDKVLDF